MTEGAAALSGDPGNGAEGAAGAGGVVPDLSGVPAGGVPLTPAVETPWYDGADESVSGYIQNKGWKNGLEAVTGYQNLEKLIGVPDDQVMKIPGPDDTEAWDAIHTKMGRPESADKYDVTMPEEGGDKELSEWFKTAAHESGLSQRQVTAMVPLWNAKMAEMGQAMNQESETQSEASIQTLRGEWGSQWNAKHAAADQAIRMLQVPDETLQKFKAAGLHAEALQLFADIGQRVKEDSFEGGHTSTQFGTTPEAAKEKIAELQRNAEFMAAYGDSGKPGHDDAVRKMARLYELANPE